MNELLPTEHWKKPSWAAIFWAIGFPVGALLIFGAPVEHLLFGWIYLPVRVLPQVTADRAMLLVGFVAVAVFMGVLHFTLGWFVRQSSPERAWSFGSTERVTALILLAFVAGVAMVGATHQAVWILMGKAGSSIDHAAAEQRFVPSMVDAVTEARAAAQRTQVKNSLRSIGLGVHNLHDVYRILPPGGTMDADGRLLHGWPIFLGNYATFSTNGVDFSIPWNEAPNDRLFRCGLIEFNNPAIAGPHFDREGYGLSHFAANRHVLTMQTIRAWTSRWREDWESRVKASGGTVSLADIRDGTSDTILIGTAAGNYLPWGHPANLREPGDGINQTADGFGGPWKGAQFLFCDGQVRMVNEKVDAEVLKSLGMPADGQRVDVDF